MAGPKPTIKQRVKVAILPSDDAQEDIELDYRVMVTGDYSKTKPGQHKDGKTLQERKVRTISNKRSFGNVLRELNPQVKLSVPNKLSGREDEALNVELEFKTMKDFHPDQIAQKVEPLKKLLEARERLLQFKAGVRSNPDLKDAVESALKSTNKGEIIDSLMDRFAPAEEEAATDSETDETNKE